MTQPAQQIDPRAALIESLHNHADTRGPLLELIKRAHPQAPIPEIDAREALRKETAPLLKEINDARAALKKEQDAAWLAEQRKRVAARVGEENIPAVEKLMQESAVGTYEAGMELYEARQRTAAPSATMFASPLSVPGLHGAGGDEYKGILTDPQWATKKAYETLNDIRSGQTARWAPFAG